MAHEGGAPLTAGASVCTGAFLLARAGLLDGRLEEIARRCGFGTVETLRPASGRRLRVSPSDYRARFATASQPLAAPAAPPTEHPDNPSVIPIRRSAP